MGTEMISKVVQLSLRAVRYTILDRSYEAYYSSDLWERKYREERYDLNNPGEDGRYGALLQVLRRHDHGPMLDLGCGDGLLWKHYRPLSDSLLMGVDYSAAAVAKAQSLALTNTEFQVGDYRTFEPGRKVAVAVFNESLYYIDDFMGAIIKTESWLDNDGLIIVSMFDTRVTRRIWKVLGEHRRWIQSLSVHDHEIRRTWTIRVLARPAATSLQGQI